MSSQSCATGNISFRWKTSSLLKTDSYYLPAVMYRICNMTELNLFKSVLCQVGHLTLLNPIQCCGHYWSHDTGFLQYDVIQMIEM